MVGYSSDITASAVARLLEIIKQLDPKIRFFQPVTSNMFGKLIMKCNELSSSTHKAPMPLLRLLHIISLVITDKLIKFTPLQQYCLIMSHLEELQIM